MNWKRTFDSLLARVGLGRVGGKRGYADMSAVGGINSDWALNGLTEDGDIYQNIYKLLQRTRDLWKESEYLVKFRKELNANVFGADGMCLQMKIKESSDRVVYSADERAYLEERQERNNLVSSAAPALQRRFFSLDGERKATVKAGQPDVYANSIIEKAWKEWKRREFCTIHKKFSYADVCRIRLSSAARDGEFFLRKVRGKSVNKFGFALQLINTEFVDFGLNKVLDNGHEIRMGIEFDANQAPVAFYIVIKKPQNWIYSDISYLWSYGGRDYQRIDAADIIHYGIFEDATQSRCAPWIVSIIRKLRQLGKYEEAEVVAARVAASKMGFFYSDLVDSGGTNVGTQPDPTKDIATTEAEPGSFFGLPYGVKFQPFDPNHPNGNYEGFRKGVLRGIASGLGSSYNILANDLEGVNYSSLRGGKLDENEMWMLLQAFDIECAEIPIFEEWLFMSLMTGAIPLPVSKFEKFNKPHFQGRRWPWVDPKKEVDASAMAVEQMFTSRSRVASESGKDFEEIVEDLAYEKTLIESAGLTVPAYKGIVQAAPEGDDDAAPTKKSQ